MRNLFYFISFIPVLLLISSCNDCKEPACPKLTSDEASWFPYAYYDTLVFYDQPNDSILYYPITYYGNSSNLYTPPNGDKCNKYCIASQSIFTSSYINLQELFFYNFEIERIRDEFYVCIKPSAEYSRGRFNSASIFDLRYANKLDAISINGELLEDVYHYTCYPAQEEVAETYVKKGIGLVKIVFRNGQEFELVEHRKAE